VTNNKKEEKPLKGECNIILEDIHPTDIFGLREERLRLLKKLFPKLQIMVRGNEIKAMGDDQELEYFEKSSIISLNILRNSGK
jgi:hypothetical protein